MKSQYAKVHIKKEVFYGSPISAKFKIIYITICLPQLDFQKNLLFGMDFGGKKRIEQRTVCILGE